MSNSNSTEVGVTQGTNSDKFNSSISLFLWQCGEVGACLFTGQTTPGAWEHCATLTWI